MPEALDFDQMAVAPAPAPARLTVVREGRSYVKAAAARKLLVTTALQLIRRGTFRPTGRSIAQAAGVNGNFVNWHFGSIDQLYRELALQHWQVLADAASLTGLEEAEQRRVVWMIMTGERVARS